MQEKIESEGYGPNVALNARAYVIYNLKEAPVPGTLVGHTKIGPTKYEFTTSNEAAPAGSNIYPLAFAEQPQYAPHVTGRMVIHNPGVAGGVITATVQLLWTENPGSHVLSVKYDEQG